MRYFKLMLLVMLVLAAALPLVAQDSGYLLVKAQPGRAGVFLDGKYLGPAANFKVARTYTVPAGKHELKLVDPRYEEVTQDVEIAKGKKTTVKHALKALAPAKPPFGILRVYSTDKYAAVYVNNKFYGHADEFSNSSQGLLLNPGEYDVRVEPASGQPITQKVKIEENKTVIVK